eukprot:CAMPEP_0202957080 /NCGR_PEP_ID=MMETSP1396-20130829/1513_1 /ASSEMBLY_ACC=CAM_ASM_000872 /TAXON_ID= /ORGANISM="Pseudokeronopsis sp., Strain Brazil" /LENGTH=56 /DNA_ID=CAMNT_0049674383 /DNA_START=666 /DNA_END=836 /DNA_ORIENTATION=-
MSDGAVQREQLGKQEFRTFNEDGGIQKLKFETANRNVKMKFSAHGTIQSITEEDKT